MTLARSLPWTDAAGRFSALKFVVFLLLLLPAVWMITEWRMGWLSPKYVTDLIREDGDWTIRLLVLTLAVTPLRLVLRWNRLIQIRRMLGLATMFYALAHFSLYCVDEGLDPRLIASEIVLRIYLTIGFVALLGLIVLGVTSNEWSIQKLGAVRWNRLQSAVYGIGLLAVIHYFIQVRLDASWAVMVAGFFGLAIAFRLVRRFWKEPGPAMMAVMSVLAGLATAGVEAGYYAIATGVDYHRVLAANGQVYPSFEADWFAFHDGLDDVLNIRDAILDLLSQIRPAWWVMAGGLVFVLLRLARPWLEPLWARRRPPARKPTPRPAE